MFEPTEEQQALKEAAREAAEQILGPTLKADDESETFRKDLMQALGEMGLCGVPTAEASGGLGLGYLDYAIVLEQIASVSASYAVSVAVTGSGEFVTAERGQPRIKLFDTDGKLRSVIAEPDAFDTTEHDRVDTDAELVTCQNGGIEVALLDGQVVALDHTTASFRLFDLA